MAAHIWGNEWAGKRITFHSDNQAVVGALNKCRSPSLAINALIRKLAVIACKVSFAFNAVHVPGVENGIADALSRFQMPRFCALAPDADPLPTPVSFDLLWP